MYITRTSKLTGIEHTLDIPVTKEQLELWEQGMLIQNAMPNLTPAQREFLMTGIIDSEWDSVFLIDDDDEDEAEAHDYSHLDTYDDNEDDILGDVDKRDYNTYDDSDDD